MKSFVLSNRTNRLSSLATCSFHFLLLSVCIAFLAHLRLVTTRYK